MNIGFTEEQRKAIYTRNLELLVSAAAGSGKTAVLVARIMNIIEKSTDIDKLLVVTFTDAAASEMRSRISEAIYKSLESDPDNEHLQRQSVLLNKAQITTIHSFCLNIVRRNFHLIDLDPNFRIADAIELKLIKSEILDNMLEEEYAKSDNEAFFRLIEMYGGGKLRDDGIRNLIMDVYEFISCSPWPKQNLHTYAEMFNLSGDIPIDATKWAEILKDEICRELKGVWDNINTALYLANSPEGPAKYASALLSDKQLIEGIEQRLNSFEYLYDYISDLKFEPLPRITNKDMVSEELKKKVQDIRKDEIKAVLQKLSKKVFIKPPEEMHRDILALYPIQKALCGYVLEFMERYAAVKRDKNLADFSDLEHFCLRILLDEDASPENPQPSQIAYALRQKYAEILIDEYQDSNLVQELILSSVAKDNPPNRFMVGDIKQSIYKFRRAMPELFLEKYNRFSKEIDSGIPNLRIDLSKNFRSRACVLNAANFFFEQLMIGNDTDILYDEQAALFPGAIFPETDKEIANWAEMHFIEYNPPEPEEDELLEEITKVELEARVISNRITELIESGFSLWDGKANKYRPVEYKDIVIIMRSVSTMAQTVIDVLKRDGIPAFAPTGGGYFDSIEIMTVISFLQIIDNPRQDMHLITVLRSPVYSLSSDELLTIRQMNKKSDFYTCIKEYMAVHPPEDEINKKLVRFTVDLEKWRQKSIYIPISKLLNIVYEETGYYNYVGVMPAGTIRQANLKALQERSVKYEKTSYKGLFHFIRYIERVKKESLDANEAKILSENENLVNLMTIHKSKGLEFPVVFVSMLGKKFNTQDERKPVLMHQSLGFGPVYIDVDKRIKSDTMPRAALGKKMHQENLSEELRALYVALTRAKELLVLTGTTTNMKKSLEKYSKFTDYNELRLPAYAVLGAGSYLDWIMYALMRHRKGAELLGRTSITGNEFIYNSSAEFKIITYTTQDIAESTAEKYIVADERAEHSYKALEQMLIRAQKDTGNLPDMAWSYPFINESSLPQKISISEIKRIYQRELITNTSEYLPLEKPVYSMPEFLKAKKVSSTLHGTLMHTVLEHMDMQKENTREDIINLVSKLCGINLIEPEQAKAINIAKLEAFARSELAGQMRRADYLKQETPFVIGLSPFEIFPYEHLKESKLTIMVHGIIDCYFESEGEIVLVDYKTDFVKDIQEITDKYSIQLGIYKKALMQSTGKNVKKCWLYLFGIDGAVEVKI